MPATQDKLLIFEDFLKKKKLRRSRQREIITGEFFRSDKHLSVEELLVTSRKQDRRIGFATVYRTLKLLVSCGLAHERDFNTGRKLYEATEAGENHSHLVCLNCGAVKEFRAPEMPDLQSKIAKQYHFHQVRYRHEMYGFCQSCQKQKD